MEHGEAVAYDLLERGKNLDDLGTQALSWPDLLLMVRRWQKMPGTATQESVHGIIWSIEAQLLAEMLDTLRLANWQRAGKKNTPKPKRTPRPWELKSRQQTIGSEPIPVSEFDEWWESQDAA
ncbi:hypothetical protein [Herbiconiux solani]|uniref:hypothetical protein n=1 Tax=Herbiconiux solani TaxID=661329 RepID=UPI0008265A51|nr:hypothetical protein [Herbiconiux solani]